MLNRTIYSGLSYLLAPFAVARLYYLSSRHKDYAKNIRQRFGYVDSGSLAESSTSVLWLHAVSVGEVIASEPFVKALLSKYPQLKICLTTMTPTGAEQVARSFPDAVKSTRIQHCYAPYDLPGAVDRFLDQLKPCGLCGLVIMETELWPNWIVQIAKSSLPSMLVNGRMSEKSARGYAKLGKLSDEMFDSLGFVSAQSEKDAARFEGLGSTRVSVTGNLKADFQLSDYELKKSSELASVLGLGEKSKVLIAASTHAGEDEIILDSFSHILKQHADIKLLLVPRHPERSKDIAKLAEMREIGYRLRSQDLALDDKHPLVICDLLGELRALYGLASIAIMGGTFVDHGGHNPLEPAAWSLPLIAGPSQRNFDLAFTALEEAGGMLRVEPNQVALSEATVDLLEDETTIKSMGKASLDYLNQNRGATEANLKLFDQLFRF